MAVQIGAKPDSGLDDPIGMLKDCHRRIEHFLEILCVVANRAAGRGLTSEETAAVQAALVYFRVGGQRHTADEEESLFPRLRAESVKSEELSGLEEDHRQANHLHAEAEGLFAVWISAAGLSQDHQLRLQSCTEQLKLLYAEHILVEERIVFPRAAQMLDSRVIAAIAQEFRSRRATTAGD
jgi:hemerythrin-like domain-containing protein